MKRRLLPILSLLISLAMLCSCGYVTLEPSSADASTGTSTEDVIAAIAEVEEIIESSEAVSSEEPSNPEEQSVSEVLSSSAVSSEAASSKAKVTTVAGDNDYTTLINEDTYEIEEDKSYTVYITDTGEKYHRSGCRYLKKSKHAISRDDARAQGYEPCKVCKPG